MKFIITTIISAIGTFASPEAAEAWAASQPTSTKDGVEIITSVFSVPSTFWEPILPPNHDMVGVVGEASL